MYKSLKKNLTVTLRQILACPKNLALGYADIPYASSRRWWPALFLLALVMSLGLHLIPHNSIYDSLWACFLLSNFLRIILSRLAQDWEQALGTQTHSLIAVMLFVMITASLNRTYTWAKGSGKVRVSVIMLLKREKKTSASNLCGLEHYTIPNCSMEFYCPGHWEEVFYEHTSMENADHCLIPLTESFLN